MLEHIRFLWKRTKEQLWFKPLLICLLSISAVLLAGIADSEGVDLSPIMFFKVHLETAEALLKIMASSMLAIATFSVGSMVSAYASASSTATPRAFPLIVADDVSQNALSVFIGAFIFSTIALVALLSSAYQEMGIYCLFIMTLITFAWVIFTFVRWVNRIARLGRLTSTIEKVEGATFSALSYLNREANYGARELTEFNFDEVATRAHKTGYIQSIHFGELNRFGENNAQVLQIAVAPGSFIVKNQPLAYWGPERNTEEEDSPQRDPLNKKDVREEEKELYRAFEIGRRRVFDTDPRFGLTALCEIASRALSPAVNDPGTAIDIVHSLTRLFIYWSEKKQEEQQETQAKKADDEQDPISYPFLQAGEPSIDDMFNDAFRPIERDGGDCIEVLLALQNSFGALSMSQHEALKQAAIEHAHHTYSRGNAQLSYEQDKQVLKTASNFILDKNQDTEKVLDQS